MRSGVRGIRIQQIVINVWERLWCRSFGLNMNVIIVRLPKPMWRDREAILKETGSDAGTNHIDRCGIWCAVRAVRRPYLHLTDLSHVVSHREGKSHRASAKHPSATVTASPRDSPRDSKNPINLRGQFHSPDWKKHVTSSRVEIWG